MQYKVRADHDDSIVMTINAENIIDALDNAVGELGGSHNCTSTHCTYFKFEGDEDYYTIFSTDEHLYEG